MEATNQNSDLFQQNAAPQYGRLKTLTTLTYIGCVLAYISLLYSVATWGKYDQQLAEAQDAQEKMRNTSMGKYM